MPGLSLITGNQLEILVDKLAQLIISAPLAHPMTPEIITVQSPGMARWISLELARRHKISANYQFPFPNVLMEKIAPAINEYNAKQAIFEPQIMSWQVMKHLKVLQNEPEFKAISNYLKNDRNELKLYQLSYRIADLFDQYTIYRPEMILDWNTHRIDLWQAILWKRLIDDGNIIDRATSFKNILGQIENGKVARELLPSRISIFGISTLPPIYLRLFEALSQIIEIYLFVINPCQEYWADILSDKETERISRKTGKGQIPRPDLHIEKGNSLLASMGKLGRDFFELLAGYNETSHFKNPGQVNILTIIQSDILNLREHGTKDLPKMQISADDDSIKIHSCHSPMREVEVLYDNLLAMFDADPELTPKDIIVMTPEIETYAPYIKAVFDSAESEEKRIPYTIADRNYKTESLVIDTLMAILDLCGSRYEASRVIAILESPVIYPRFSLSLPELDLIDNWLKKVNIRWGRDKKHKAELGLPEYYENTWRFGLDRLLLGYALPSGDQNMPDRTLYKGILPYNQIEGEFAQTLGKFADFVDRLFTFTAVMEEAMTLDEWSALLIDICDKLFISSDDTERDLQLLRRASTELAEIRNNAGFDDPVALDIIKQYLKDRFTRHGSGSGFIAGAVTFCAMLPMRSIPFKVICLIGMNNDSFPRQAAPLSFDLIAANPRPGDRSVRNTDRYLFLEAMLSARQKLYLSYTGQSIQDNSPIPASVVVSELIDYINRSFFSEAGNIDDQIIIKHRLQAFSPEYFKTNKTLFSYSSEDCLAAKALLAKADNARAFLPDSLPETMEYVESVDINDLCRFFANPAKFLLNKRLGVYLDDIGYMLEDDEPFAIKGLDKYRIEDDLLQKYLAGMDIDRQYAILKASGNLPHGAIGETSYRNIAGNIKKFATRIEQYLVKEKLPPYQVNIQLEEFLITGVIDNTYDAGLVQYRPAIIKAKDLLNIWIRHLLINLNPDSSYPKNSILIGSDLLCTFGPLENSQEILLGLLRLFLDGSIKPLPFFPETSLKFATDTVSGKEDWKALSSAKYNWAGGEHYRGEREDSYFKLCFRQDDPLNNEFKRIAMSVFAPILANGKSQR